MVGPPSAIALPDTVQGVIASRLDRLDDGARELLKIGAVIGRTFLYRVLLALAGPADETVATPHAVTEEEIAARLFLNLETVRAHLGVLFERFGVATLPPDQRRNALVAMARARGLLLPARER